MKMIEKLNLFLGKPFKIGDDIYLFSPTVDEIAHIGENKYSIYLFLCSFDTRKILIELLEMNEDDVDQLKEEEYFLVLCEIPNIRIEICNALSFFTRNEVYFDEKDYSFKIDSQIIVDSNIYDIMASLISELNGIELKKEEKDNTPKMKIPKSMRKMYAKMLKEEKEANAKKQKEGSLSLKNILSILCNAADNGINIFNVGQLTIYQVYEQFERMGLKESYQRILPVWANGNLGEKGKVPEWIVDNTKL